MNNTIEKKDLQLLRQLMEMIKNPHTHLHSVDLDLTEANIEYAFTGGVALAPHNYVRATEDIDILVSKKTAGNLKNLIGHGYTLRVGATNNMFLHTGSLRVPVDIIIEGQNKSGVIAPNPVDVRQRIGGVWYVSLPALIELKIGSVRGRDKDDVRRLIELNRLTTDFAQHLRAPFREAFLRLL